MKLSISNIAFKGYPFEAALDAIKPYGILGIELAPSMVFENPLASTRKERDRIKEIVGRKGFSVIGLHAICYQRADLRIFGSGMQREKFIEHIKGMCQLCSDLGGGLISFGAAGSRNKGALSEEEALRIAVPFFQALAKAGEERKVVICLEPLAVDYGCDFITTADQAAQIVQEVNRSHLRMLLDTGTMKLNQESFEGCLDKYFPWIHHLHINDPHLAAPALGDGEHLKMAGLLNHKGYRGWLTLEFLSQKDSLLKDLAYALECYEVASIHKGL